MKKELGIFVPSFFFILIYVILVDAEGMKTLEVSPAAHSAEKEYPRKKFSHYVF